MMGKFQTWMAGNKERQRAMVISAASMLLILFIVSMQDFSPPAETETTQRDAYTIPPKPQEEPEKKSGASKSTATFKPAPITPATPAKNIQSAVAGSFYVQVGAFRDSKRAETQLNRLQKMGWNTALKKKKDGIYAVWAGPWQSLKQAKSAQEKLKRQARLKGFIVRHK